MQKMNVFVFITLLLNSIQANEDFDTEGLLQLHNDERSRRSLEKLIRNPLMDEEAYTAAKVELNTNLMAVSELYGINLYRFDQTNFPLKYIVTPEMVFSYWLMNEVVINDNEEVVERPLKIILDQAKEIGIGYAIEGDLIVVIALYSINNTMSNNTVT